MMAETLLEMLLILVLSQFVVKVLKLSDGA